MLPISDCTFDNKLTKRIAHKDKIEAEFWDKWSDTYYQTLVKYHRWKLRSRNAQCGDVILVLDREGPKGKFTLGIIDSVKVDDDGRVRRVTIKYKLPQKGNTTNYQIMPYKYAERNVRGLALVTTAEERDQVEDLDLDLRRLAKQTRDENSVTDDISGSDDESSSHSNKDDASSQLDENDVNEIDGKEVSPDDTLKKKVQLQPTSSGRKRFKPDVLDL